MSSYDAEQFPQDDPMTFEEWIDMKDGSLCAAYLKARSRLAAGSAINPKGENGDEWTNV